MATDTEEIARGIANKLYAIAEGYMYRDQDGETHDVEADGIDDVPEDWEQVTMYDYLEDNLGVRYVVPSTKYVRSGLGAPANSDSPRPSGDMGRS